MKLSVKLPLAFALASICLLLAALYGIYSLNQSINTYQTEVVTSAEHVFAITDIAMDFKTQVQEWKNVLLRGSKPEQLSKYWDAFLKEEGAVSSQAKKLMTELPAGDSRTLVDKFVQAHSKMGEHYRKGLEQFKAANLDATAGDQAVQGMDREPIKLLDEAMAKIQAESTTAAAGAAVGAKRATVISLVLMVLVCGLSVVFGIWLSRGVLRQLGGEPLAAVNLAQRVARGDLSDPIALASGDNTSLVAQLDAMQESLAKVVSQVRQNSESVEIASAEIAQGNNDLSARTESQASALEETASSMEQLGATVKQNADSARQANQLAVSASSVAVKGGEVVAQVVDTMKGINEASQKISDIISVIDGIAFQTNILALNAAVEAARAGEQGRGFAVVASEVRSLAGRSAEAAREIKTLINASVERVEQGTALVDQAGTTMTEVVSSIHRVTDIMGEISAASSEQALGVSQVGEAVTQMDQTTQQNAALVEEMAAAASSLKAQAQELVRTVAVFKLAPGHEKAAAFRSPVAVSKPRNVTSAAPLRRPVIASPKRAALASQTKSLAAPAKSDGTDEWETF